MFQKILAMEYNKVLEYFDKQANDGLWDDLYNPSNYLSHSFIHRYRKSISLISIIKGKKILDLGCGTGVLIPYILENKLKYYGIDNSNDMLNFIKKKYSKNFDNIKLIYENFDNYDHKDNIDVYFGIGFIEYFEQPFKRIDTLIDNLNDDGQIILSFPNKISLDNLMLKLFFIPKKIIKLIFNISTNQPPRTMFTFGEVNRYVKSKNNIKLKYKFYNTNIFVYPFTKFFPKFANYMGNFFEDSFLNKFSFFSSGFIVLFEKKTK